MKNISVYERGETFSHWITIRDKTDKKVDPSSVSMSIVDPNGNTVLNKAAMTNSATGIYYYDHDLSSSASYGKYIVRIYGVSGTAHTGIEEDAFYIMPWKLEQGIRHKMGISTNDIEDDALTHIAWSSYKESLEEIYLHHYKESPKCNPDTGVGFNGTNTSFQTQHYPIADIDGDGSIGDSSVENPDITCWWLDNAGHRNTGYVSITESNNGEISVYQFDGATAIPSTNEGVYLKYWSEYNTFSTFLFREAVSYLAAHYVNLRFTERDKVTIADLNANRPIVLKYPNRFLREYKRIISRITKPRISGVS